MAIAPEQLVQVLMEERVKIQAFIRSIVPDYHIAEDVYQEVSMLAFREASSIKDREHLLAWVRRAARHRAINASKRSSRRALPLDEELLTAIEASWARIDQQSSSETAEALEKCIGMLTPSARRLIHLRYTEGMTGDQLAGVLKRNTASTYVTLSRIHRTLERCIRTRIGRPIGKGVDVA